MIAQLKIRLPAEMQDWLKKEAAKTGASLNNEVVRAIREKMERMDREAKAFGSH